MTQLRPFRGPSLISGSTRLTEMAIKTAHLELVPCLPEYLLWLIAEDGRFEERFGLPAADGLQAFVVADEVSPSWLERLRASSLAADPWVHGFAVVLLENRSVIGTVGFKGPPDKDGVVEIAYGIMPVFQGHGYATEATEAAVAFAFGSGQVRHVRAHTFPTLNASARVLAKCGFTRSGEVEDPENGLVWRWGLWALCRVFVNLSVPTRRP